LNRSRITRRAVLRGAGVAIALPFLESWLPAEEPSRHAPPLRVAFTYAPNGKHLPDWTPKDVGAVAELPPTLRPLQDVKDQVTVLSGLAQRNANPNGEGPGDHARAMATFLTGCRPHKTSGADVRVGVSVDQLIADAVGRATRLPSLEVGCEGGKPGGTCDNGYSCAYQTNLSWRTASSPMPKETDPRVVFERLFGDRLRPESDAARARRERERLSVLDFVAEDARDLCGGLGGADRRRLDEYLTSVREVERRLQQSQPAVAVGRESLVRPAGVPENFEKHAQLLADLVVLAFEADLTRVATFVLGNDGSNRSYREAGVAEGHHDVSHHGNDPARFEKLRRINTLHVGQLAYLLGRLKAIPQGAGTLLDQCLIVYGSGISDGDRHNHDDLPILLAGGGGGIHRGGRHVRSPDGTPLCNLYLALLGALGVADDRFGDSTGRLGVLRC
jgi:Protein of unknown function (DUF1552)